MLDNKTINRTKYFLSPARPQSIIGAAEPLAQIGLIIAVRPTDCKILINNSPVFADTDAIFTEKTLISSYERTITVRKTGKASICIVIDKLNRAHGWASRTAYNPYGRLEPFARQQPDTLPQSAQKDYESMREYKDRITRKKEQGRYDNVKVTLPR
jgi:hypothetical protein